MLKKKEISKHEQLADHVTKWQDRPISLVQLQSQSINITIMS